MQVFIEGVRVKVQQSFMEPQSMLGSAMAEALCYDVSTGDTVEKSIEVVTDRGQVSTRVAFRVMAGMGEDVILGRDWFTAYVQKAYDNICGGNIQSVMTVSGNGSSTSLNLVHRLEDVFNESSQLFVFATDSGLLHGHLASHGIDPPPSTVDECHGVLAQHILSGSCVVNKESGMQFRACKRMARDFRDSLHMSYNAYEHFLRTSSTHADRLRLVSKAVGALQDPRRYDLEELVEVLEGRQAMIVKTHLKLNPYEKCVREMYSMTKGNLCFVSRMHGLSLDTSLSRQRIRDEVIKHVVQGGCLEARKSMGLACCSFFLGTKVDEDGTVDDRRKRLWKTLAYSLKRKDLLEVVRSMGLEVEPSSSLRSLQIVVANRTQGLEADVKPLGQNPVQPYHIATEYQERSEWPCTLEGQEKDVLISNFLRETSTSALSRRICGVCREFCPVDEVREEFVANLPMELLSIGSYGAIGCLTVDLRTVTTGLLSPYLIDPLAVRNLDATDIEDIQMDVCKSCHDRLMMNRLPACALANGNVVGDVPGELRQLSMVEEAMIALCRTKCMIIQLREVDGVGASAISQKALKGNVIIYPQDTPSISKILPPSVADIATLICVMFIGSQALSDETILRSTPLAVRADRIYGSLRWLKQHNHLYKDITINMTAIEELRGNDYLPLHVERTEWSQSAMNRTSRYDEDVENIPPQEVGYGKDAPFPFQSVLITGVDPVSPPNVLRSAALRHLKEGGGNYLRIPHGQEPVNSFDNPSMFPMMYPSLFPFGIGGFDDNTRRTPLSMKIQVRHMLNLFDRRYQEHHGFMFSVFNILQRRERLLRTSLRTRQISFPDIAAQLTSISLETVTKICERLKKSEKFIPENEHEKRVYKLMREVNVINGSVWGSPSSKIIQRNELRALMLEEGLPNFFITVNPADVYNPIVKLLAGADIDIDNMLEADIPKFWEQSITVTRNPCVAARFFNLYMKAFIRCLLGYRKSGYKEDDIGGVLGMTKAYYGCVETQGRGTLHCHMLVWLEGALNPDEIKRKVTSDGEFAARILGYLEDLIQNEIPPDVGVEIVSDKHHPSTVRSVDPTGPHSAMKRMKDFRNVVKSSQRHKHSDTCFKYCRGSVRECRFGLGVERERLRSEISVEGEINLRCKDGLVNDYNPTMIEALRCNMDIKFIGSGVSAKAALYYITDYITKMDLKSYAAYSALELAVQRLGEYNSDVDLPALRSKKMLQKCANAMISRQELSAPIVATYLMGYEDHYSSHAFSKIYWLSFERFVDAYLRSIDEISGVDEDLEDKGGDRMHKQADNLDIVFDTDAEGVITPLASQVDDYVNRSQALEAFCVWDTVAQLVKVPRRKTSQGLERSKSSSVYEFLPGHQDYTTHDFHARSLIHVPVPIGPGLPRRDREETLERHARVMLILFKPWRKPSDLRDVADTWIEAYRAFLLKMPRHTRDIIDNMQLLHECRDSKDDHYDAMRRIRKVTNFVDRGRATEEDENSLPAVVDDVEMLEYLESIDNVRSHTEAQKSLDVAQCMLSAVESGLVKQFSSSLSDLSSGDEVNTVMVTEETAVSAVEWRKAYNDLDALRSSDTVPLGSVVQPVAEPASIQQGSEGVFQDVDKTPKIVSLSKAQRVLSGEEVMTAVENEYSLNREQKRAFRIVATHSVQNISEQLRMFIMGHGGTGKSRVIQALTSFFARPA